MGGGEVRRFGGRKWKWKWKIFVLQIEALVMFANEVKPFES
jgi:hypothetical protein